MQQRIMKPQPEQGSAVFSPRVPLRLVFAIGHVQVWINEVPLHELSDVFQRLDQQGQRDEDGLRWWFGCLRVIQFGDQTTELAVVDLPNPLEASQKNLTTLLKHLLGNYVDFWPIVFCFSLGSPGNQTATL